MFGDLIPTYFMPTDQWHQHDPVGQRGPDGMPQLPHVEELLKDYQDGKIYRRVGFDTYSI